MVTLGKADLILVNGQFHTVDRENPVAEAVAVRDGKFLEVGTVAEVMQHHCDGTKVVDLKGHTAIPGLNDSHLHLIRGGLNYNLELRWEGVPSLADALRMLKEQALRTPSPQWVRVVGGWSEFQFANAACQPWTKSTTPRRTPRSLSCTSTTAPCSTAPR